MAKQGKLPVLMLGQAVDFVPSHVPRIMGSQVEALGQDPPQHPPSLKTQGMLSTSCCKPVVSSCCACITKLFLFSHTFVSATPAHISHCRNNINELPKEQQEQLATFHFMR